MNISIILAAGEGTRMKSNYSKVLHKVCDKPILEYVIESSKGANVSKNIVVVGENEEQVKTKFGSSLIYKKQEIGEDIPYGTGYAVMQAIDEINDDSRVLILYGDTPLITPETIEYFVNHHEKNKNDATVLTAIIENPSGYGRIIREENNSILKIVEEKDASLEEKKIREVNSGIYCFNGKLLKESLKKINNNNAQNEYYITDVIEILKNKGYNVGACIIEDSREIHGVNSRSQLAYCEKIMRERINYKHMNNGVTIIDPNNTYIGSDVKIGQDTIIYPGVLLEGETEIGSSCKLGQNTRIVNSKIADFVNIESSVIEDSIVSNNANIGPYSHLRPNSNIGENVRLGNFVEVKNSNLGNNTKAAHLAYIGDADIEEDVNIGCGVIFVNYDGVKKHRASVKKGAFIGSNSNIISPVEIKSKGFVAAGSTITDSIGEGDLAIARAKQVVKKNWIKK